MRSLCLDHCTPRAVLIQADRQQRPVAIGIRAKRAGEVVAISARVVKFSRRLQGLEAPNAARPHYRSNMSDCRPFAGAASQDFVRIEMHRTVGQSHCSADTAELAENAPADMAGLCPIGEVSPVGWRGDGNFT